MITIKTVSASPRLLILVAIIGSGVPAAGFAENVRKQCEEAAAEAGLAGYPELVRQYVIECVEQYQPGSRESLESSYAPVAAPPPVEETNAAGGASDPGTDPGIEPQTSTVEEVSGNPAESQPAQ